MTEDVFAQWSFAMLVKPYQEQPSATESLAVSVPDQRISAFYTSDSDKDTGFQAVHQGLLWVISSYKRLQLSISLLF